MTRALFVAVCAVALVSATPAQTPPTPPTQTQTQTTVHTSLSDLELRELLATVDFGAGPVRIVEEKDADGLTAFFVHEGETVLFALYQYRDQPEGPVTSLGLSVGTRLERAADVRRINAWNANRRFVKAYVDDEGDAMLAADLLLSPGVTKTFVKEWIRLFVAFSREFNAHLKGN